eukprot:655390-Prymnesium_polylepis.1
MVDPSDDVGEGGTTTEKQCLGCPDVGSLVRPSVGCLARVCPTRTVCMLFDHVAVNAIHVTYHSRGVSLL